MLNFVLMFCVFFLMIFGFVNLLILGIGLLWKKKDGVEQTIFMVDYDQNPEQIEQRVRTLVWRCRSEWERKAVIWVIGSNFSEEALYILNYLSKRYPQVQFGSMEQYVFWLKNYMNL